jgi:hypothetical protein
MRGAGGRRRTVARGNARRAGALGRAMTHHATPPNTPPPKAKPPTMFGFLCAGCGRCLEELRAWQLGAERFYCGIFCCEADERLERQPARAWPKS